jgi:hypothetical protein
VHDATANVDGDDGIRARIEEWLNVEAEGFGSQRSRGPRSIHVTGLGGRRGSRQGHLAGPPAPSVTDDPAAIVHRTPRTGNTGACRASVRAEVPAPPHPLVPVVLGAGWRAQDSMRESAKIGRGTVGHRRPVLRAEHDRPQDRFGAGETGTMWRGMTGGVHASTRQRGDRGDADTGAQLRSRYQAPLARA